ncbi:DUF3545 family protein [Photobacterium sp. CCB-ST2H9]|uniref:DUF3545 family protein n=1 Tax=unclassified Photobacterium TaxID=2628852 RepID=UPI0020047436|nr:DUF3545 family protein [Photobacterium sp. CCB-ST2H9]UTM56804.1 DUF3545 family protein [Photobacterium sp. CCB-ST2H9]
MDSFGFDNILESDLPRRNSRSKPVKRKWREIEALKDKQRLKKELQEIDILHEFTDEVDI